jgi:hypothetical protein
MKNRIIIFGSIAIMLAAIGYLYFFKNTIPVIEAEPEPTDLILSVDEQKQMNNDWICVPGKRVGPITKDTTEADLIRIFGAKHLAHEKYLVGEGEAEEWVTVIFPGTRDRVSVKWRANQKFKNPGWSVSDMPGPAGKQSITLHQEPLWNNW